MALFVPAPAFPFQVNNSGEVSNLGPDGTSYTAGASNTKGSVTQLLSGLAFEAQLVAVQFGANFQANTNTNTLTDIVIDPAGGTSWDTDNPLIPNLLSGWNPAGANFPKGYVFPLRIPKGASVGARGQTIRGATADVPVIIFCLGGASPETWWSGQGVDAIGIDAANSRGQMHTPGASQAFSSWANLGPTTARAYRALVFGTQGGHTDTVMISQGTRWQIGMNDSQIGPDFYAMTDQNERMAGLTPRMPIFASIPADAQLQVRAAVSGASPEAIDVAAYGVY